MESLSNYLFSFRQLKTHWVSIVERLKVQSGRGEHNTARIAHKRRDPFCCKKKKTGKFVDWFPVTILGQQSIKIVEQMLSVTLTNLYYHTSTGNYWGKENMDGRGSAPPLLSPPPFAIAHTTPPTLFKVEVLNVNMTGSWQ